MVEEDTRPVKYVCDDCGSGSLERKVYSTWSIAEQKWIEDDYDVSWYCMECGSERGVSTVPLDARDYAVLAIHKAEKEKTDD